MTRGRFPMPSAALLALILVLFFDPGSFAAENSVSFDVYVSELERCLRVAKLGDTELKPALPPGLHVRMRDGSEALLYRKQLMDLIDEANQSPAGRKSLVRFLEALLRQVAGDGRVVPWTDQDWTQSRERLEHMYRLKEFEHLREEAAPLWLEELRKLFRRLTEWVAALFKTMEEKVPGRWARYALYGFILFVAALFVFLIVRNFRPSGWRWRSVSLSLKPAPQARPAEEDWNRWRSKAAEEASRGSFRDAVRSFFLSVLMEGHERGWWTYNPEATNMEHLKRVEGPRERYEALEQLISLYEKLWYGQEEAGNESYRRCAEWLRRMEAAS